MQRPASTRMELLERKAQVALARRGRDLLDRKRSALVAECTRLQDLVRRLRGDLEDALQHAAGALAEAEALAGAEAVATAALRAGGTAIQVATANVSGVRVPILRRLPPAEPAAWVPDRSPAIGAAGAAFAETVDVIVRVAEAQAQWARVRAEVRRLSRQVNALDTLLIPRLEAERDHIELALEERERSARFQLKLVQRRLALRQEG